MFGQPTISLEDLKNRLNAALATRYRPYAGALVSYPKRQECGAVIDPHGQPLYKKGAKEVIRRLELAA